ncbi:MAG: butyrate kinase [Gammaproteobacteria bacterium]|nr:MAG: butyrate kinase [Gammaproteobacteria bacterium]
MANYLILTINPGSTSTKFAVFSGEDIVLLENINHNNEELAVFEKLIDQFDMRKLLILEALNARNIDIIDLDAVVGRGGLLKPIPGGTYKVNQAMINDLYAAEMGEHASNLGALIADAIAQEADCESYIVDPVVVDELNNIARYSGNPLLPRVSIFHALNQKRTARIVSEQIGKEYLNSTIIVAHMGGGISVGLHENGKVIDVNNALDGDGPFTPERSGGIPAGSLVGLCFSGKYDQKQIKKMIKGEGGLVAYLGTNDLREVEDRIEQGDRLAKQVYEAMAYQIAKEIGSLAAVVNGIVDAIALTGGVAHSENFTKLITQRVGFIADVIVMPGENELESLRDGAARVLSGEDLAKEY